LEALARVMLKLFWTIHQENLISIKIQSGSAWL